MKSATSFRDLIRRVRTGDSDAATELVRRYEPEIRREVRMRLTDPDLRRVVDSMDITQSVLGNFFARAALGQFDLRQPSHLVGLLVTMARNKVTDWARSQYAGRRDRRREKPLVLHAAGASRPRAMSLSPSQEVSAAELLEQFRKRLSPAEQQIAERRATGGSWSQIADELGESAEALRKRLSRALDRVSRELGLGEVSA